MGNSEPSSVDETQNHPQSDALKPPVPFSPSDLPIDEAGRIYHLRVKPGQIAPNIIIVGHPGRAEFIGSNYLRDIECTYEHRGLVTITGRSDISTDRTTIITPVRTSVTTSGMGTPSLEIVMGELVALNEIDFKTRRRKRSFPRLHVIRVGTSGGLQASTKLGTPIITSYAVGMDNTGLFYEAPPQDEICERLEGELERLIGRVMNQKSRFFGKIHPYVTRAEPRLVGALAEAARSLGVATRTGLTVSNPGFSAPQGRDIFRVKPSIPDLDKVFSEFDPRVGGQQFENMEMEASFLIHFLGSMGHWAGAICPAIANRRQDTFDTSYQEAIKDSVEVALLALANLRNQYPDVQIG
jgi:uridine phosphorylase